MLAESETIHTPAGVTSLTFGSDEVLAVGSADGTLRAYRLPFTKVAKAIRQLPDEISSIVWSSPASTAERKLGEVWVASGTNVYLFDLDKQKLILTPEDAKLQVHCGQDDEDVLNELSLSKNKQYLAFSSDSGSVGIVNVSTKEVTRMKIPHNSICGSVKIIPDRPNEIVSGGYDSTLRHYDFMLRNQLTHLDIAPPPPSSGVSLSPPFILSIALSSTGLVVASTADGRIWFGTGGDKASPSHARQKKRSRKWGGLVEEGAFVQIADGPVVATALVDDKTLITCTLLGTLAKHSLSYDDESGNIESETVWTADAKSIEKVNGISVSGNRLAVGGITKDGKGVVEIWKAGEKQN
ncbi:WD40 repeat-like protein [Panus rudis PR-1116 ss-1]|nr:WD40 repeat-like protein [Panus rudis PR-1116 ss-1]